MASLSPENKQESHFNLTIVSEKFAGIKLIDRHRQVMESLEKELKPVAEGGSGVHALQIKAKTPEQWNK